MCVRHMQHEQVCKSLKVSFTGGSVMGLGVAGLAVLGLGGLFIVFKHIFAPGASANSDRNGKNN